MNASPLALWQSLSTKPGGKWLFSRAICLKAPYFASISPRFEVVRPGLCEVSVRKHRAVLNHIGTVHAIAMCNMAELAGGTLTEVSVPSSHRWIPKGMTVEYLKKAETDLRAVATPVGELPSGAAGEYPVQVEVFDAAGDAVFRAVIRMWVSAKK